MGYFRWFKKRNCANKEFALVNKPSTNNNTLVYIKKEVHHGISVTHGNTVEPFTGGIDDIEEYVSDWLDATMGDESWFPF